MAVATLTTHSSDPFLAQETRRKIYDYIAARPGLHLRKLSRELEMPMGKLEYHLHKMERGGYLATRELNRFKAYFVKEDGEPRDKDFLYYLRQKRSRQILMEIADHPYIGFNALQERLPVSASTLSFHLKKLVRAKIVEEFPTGREKKFRLRDGPRFHRLIVRYGATLEKELVDEFQEAYLGATLDDIARAQSAGTGGVADDGKG